MRCPRCEIDLPETSAFCFACGARVTHVFRPVQVEGEQVSLTRPPAPGYALIVPSGPASPTAETAPFEPSPISGGAAVGSAWAAPAADSAGPRSDWSAPAAGPRSDWSAPAAGPRSDWSAPAANPAPVPAPASSDDSSIFDLEMRLARRRQRIHVVLVIAIAALLAGAAALLWQGLKSLREARAAREAGAEAPGAVAPATPGLAATLAEVEGPGRVDRGAVTDALRRGLLPALRGCFSPPRGTVALAIGAAGALESLTVDGRPPRGGPEQDCVRAAVAAWRPPVPRGGAVTLRIPLEAP